MELVEMDSSTVHHHHLHHHHHHQQQEEMSSQTLESMLACSKSQQQPEKKPRPAEQALKCPRCDSTNTKFCYYNNYSLTQPRYFCKSCRRYWTKGGTLRNVPVGGGCRKKQRSSSSTPSNSSSSSAKRAQEHTSLLSANSNSLLSGLTHLPYDSTTDLSLAFARLQSQANGQFGFDHHHESFLGVGGGGASANAATHNDHFLENSGMNFLDAIRGGFLENGIPNGFYYGDMGSVGNGGDVLAGEMGTNAYSDEQQHQQHSTSAVTVTTVKQESCNGRDGGGTDNNNNNNRILFGFPWQIGGHQENNNNNNNMVEVDSAGRQMIGWNNNGLGSTWHGLLNTPLM